VLIEVRTPAAARSVTASAAAMDAGRKLPGFAHDERFNAVPIRTGGFGGVPGLRLAAMARVEQAGLLRGELDPDAESELRRREDVVAVWSDPPITPFERAPLPAHFLQLSQGLTASAAEASRYCSPGDCNPTMPKGDLAAVARFLNCDQLWQQRITGAGVVIGICDTGVDRNVVPNLIDGWSPDPYVPYGIDSNGHGTMTATDALGTALDAKIVDIGVVKAPDALTAISNALAGFQWALDMYRGPLRYPHILSNSWGIYQKSWALDYATNPNHPFTRKVREVINAGVIVLFSAGNCGGLCADMRCGADTGPGNSIWGANSLEEVITVGAANIHNEWAGYSSQGPGALYARKPDVVAPTHFTGYYSCDAGTSAACPVAAGVVALLKQSRFFQVRPADIRRALIDSARDLCDPGWDAHSGYGMINAKAAYDKLTNVQ
jgi:hypothetical protein